MRPMLDYYRISDQFTDEERQMQASVREFLDAEARPHAAGWWERGEFPHHLVRRFADMGLIGANMPREYGGAEVGSVAYGLVMYELERIDSGLRSFASVQGALCMYPILTYGSEEQRRMYLPAIASGRTIGCFGLTEHSGGSDPGAMQTRARREGGSYVLNGVKVWISYGTIADIAVIWARDEDDGEVRGFVVPTDTPGFTARKIERQMSLRISGASELVMEDARIPASAMLPRARGLSAALSCLTRARYGIAWGVLGALEDVYCEALDFARARKTFGKPIAARQLVQDKLATMLTSHTSGLLRAWHLGRLADAGNLRHTHVSLAKRENTRTALEGARLAREILGGSGITLDHCALRHLLNLETVDTYEGTRDIHTLVLGRDSTGIDAFA